MGGLLVSYHSTMGPEIWTSITSSISNVSTNKPANPGVSDLTWSVDTDAEAVNTTEVVCQPSASHVFITLEATLRMFVPSRLTSACGITRAAMLSGFRARAKLSR